MPSNKPYRLADELEKVYTANATRLREIGGRSQPQDAADVVHDAFAKTLDAGRRQTIRDPLHFVFKVTRNTVLSRLRDSVRRMVRPFHEEEHAEPTVSLEHSALASERLSRAMLIIEGMPTRRREAFLLHRIEELSYAQIARRMKISIKAVEKHMSMALAQLHREIDA
jgi:RNA polymerase sigma factor (sigma-70 family)